MNNKIAILGSGPSLELFLPKKTKYDVVVGCNSLLVEPWFCNLENSIYVAHEKRLINKLWHLSLLKYPNKKYISDPLYSELVGSKRYEIPSNCFHLNKLLMEDVRTSNYLRLFSEIEDLNKNVVLDFSIPLALFLKASNIDLYGCDFSYGEKETPDYFHKNGTVGTFVHSISSKAQWEKASNLRFETLKKYLLDCDVEVQRFVLANRV